MLSCPYEIAQMSSWLGCVNPEDQAEHCIDAEEVAADVSLQACLLPLQIQQEVEQHGWILSNGGSEQIITLPRK